MSTIGSFRTLTPYQQVTQMNSQLYDAQTTNGDAILNAIINKMSGAANSRITGMANLAGKAALKRIKAAAAAKQAAQQAQADADAAKAPLPSKQLQDVTLSDGTIIKAPPVALAGGARIDMARGTMTRSDGVIVDLKTGYPVPKIDTTA